MIFEPVRLARHDRRRFADRVAVFGSGATAAAAAFGALLGFVGSELSVGRPVPLATALVLVGAVIAREIFGIPIPVPHRQVPNTWLRRFWIGSFGFGAVMGLGFLTFTSSFLYYVYLAACLLSASPGAGTLVGTLYGVSFTAVVLGASVAWRNALPAEQAEKAYAVGQRAASVGALSSPLIVVLPATWSVLTGGG